MRTDSVRIAPEAIAEARAIYPKNIWQRLFPAEAKAIFHPKKRPRCPRSHPPDQLESSAGSDQSIPDREQFMLYQLIWRRFLASQMMPAIYDTVSADLMLEKMASS